MSGHIEKFTKVNVSYDKKTGYLCIDDWETDEQLAVFYVQEEE